MASNCMVPPSLGGGEFGLSSNLTSGEASFVQNLISSGGITEPVFSLFLDDVGFNGTEIKKIESNLCIGGYDLETYSQEPKLGFQTHQTDKASSLWMLNLTTVNFNNEDFPATGVFIDVGFPYIAGPSNELNLLIKEIQSVAVCQPLAQTTALTCLCQDTASLPTITFTIDSTQYSIDSSSYQNQADGQCEVYLFPSNQTFWVLGQIFLRNYYSVWNYTGPSMGFAPARIAPSGSSGGSGSNFSKSWIIAVVVIVALLVAGGAIAILYMVYKKRSMRSSSESSRDSMISLDQPRLN